MTTAPITHEDLIRMVEESLEAHALTLADFVAAGQADQIEDDDLRDLWLMTKSVLREPAAR